MATTLGQAINGMQDPKRRNPLAKTSLPTPTAPQQNVSKPVSVSVNSKPVCGECGGAGWWCYDVEINHPMFGKTFPCKACNAGAIAGATGLNPIEREIRFADIETDARPGAARMLAAATAFVAGGCRGFLTVHGDWGNGKSTLLKAIVNEAVAKGVSARYITMTEVMAYAREAFQSQKAGDTDYGRIADLAKVHVLAIDELDKARLSDYAFEVQSHLFDYRYRNAHEVGTVLAWNGEFNQIDLPSVLSRLSQYPVIRNTDPDMRPLLAK